jgi:hypothetical protein
MSRNVATQIAEIEAFISAFKPSHMSKSDPAWTTFVSTYQYFHCVLIWQEALDGSSKLKPDVKNYLNEATSDFSQSVLCVLLNLYKPSRMMLPKCNRKFFASYCGSIWGRSDVIEDDV